MTRQFTEAMAKIMESWGWRFLGVNPVLDKQWSKYEKGILVATFASETWDRDIVAARLKTEGKKV